MTAPRGARANPAPPPGVVVPEGYTYSGPGTCREASCRAPISWTVTRAGKRAPLNLDGTSHYATCPAAASFRRRS